MPQAKTKIVSDTKGLKSLPAKPSDFSNEYIDKKVRVKLADGSIIEGVLLEASKYWFKIRGSTLVYVNKAWVISVEPVS